MKKGPLFEKQVVVYLQRAFGGSIERRVMGAVVFHRKGRGAGSMGEQYVLMDLRTLARLLGGDADD